MNPNNELLQAAKEVLRLSDRKHDAWDALRTAIARAEASASQPAADEQREKAIEELASRVTRRVAEMPDRSSPEDWPEAMLVTSDELVAIIEDEAIALMRSAPPAPAVLYSCPACGAEMDSSRCWCCGWSNK